MKKLITALIGVLFLWGMLNPGAAFAGEPFGGKQGEQGIEKALIYFQGVQNADGGFTAQKGGTSSKKLTGWVIIALEAAGEDAANGSWAPSGKSPLDFLKNSPQPLEETSDYALQLLAYAAAGQGASTEAQELTSKILSFQQEDGQFWQPDKGEQGMINAHMWSVLSLSAVGKEIPQKDKVKSWLLRQQNQDGGFGWLEGMDSDVDDTAIAIQTLIMLGETPDSPSVRKALAFIKGLQQENGGFSAGDWMGGDANASSNAWAIQGILAAGENPQGADWTVGQHNPVTHLLSLANQDGSFNWKEGVSSSPVNTTVFAVLALAGKPHPVNMTYGFQNSTAGTSGLFSDLSSDYWAYESIEALVKEGVLSGYPDGTFGPERPVTRAEFTKFLISGLDLPKGNNDSAARFSDIPENHWARSFISAAVDQGYINGRPDGTFDGNGKIIGAELSAMLVRALPQDKKDQLTEGPKWYSSYVETARKEGLLYPQFEENVVATRAQCSFSINQLIKLLSKN
ncbi:S-layer homology domain-containing protein [Dehalobacterium formicoaceticum]|uniref:S-layer homology domain-containing protein n=1 Tax=Dehalobacterium formicoaceticum TaxID=51515 RepID=A0ABT1Y571_9FIRM|nr:S-layer homology domain-containing protein [Dehalobacterium formicoaceticum]MCR6544841.1 S-layer homology domain-containing protein [Dehalobacterium formicoaceticum]